MASEIIFAVKALLLTEALTHAIKSWGIFDDVRSRIARRSDFLSRLLACFECVSVWTATAVFVYLYFLDFWPFTFIIIISRLATIGHIVIDLVDSLRAVMMNKI